MSVQTTLLEADKAVRTALENQGLYFSRIFAERWR